MSENTLHILFTVGMFLIGAAVTYLKNSQSLTIAKIKSKAPEIIAQAEQEYASVTKAGGEKMEWAIDRLYVFVPVWLQPVLTRKAVQDIVQFVFDCLESYARQQLDRLTDKVAK